MNNIIHNANFWREALEGGDPCMQISDSCCTAEANILVRQSYSNNKILKNNANFLAGYLRASRLALSFLHVLPRSV